PIPGVRTMRSSFTDTSRDIVYFEGAGADGAFVLYGVDGKTGTILSSAPVPPFTYNPATERYQGFAFGGGIHLRSDGTFVGLAWNGDLAREELRAIDPKTYTHTLIAVIPGITTLSSHYTDTKRNLVYVNAAGTDGVWHVFGIDAKTGAVRSSPLLPPFT